MITSSESPRRGNVLRNTLLISLVLHVILMAATIDLFALAIVSALRHGPKPPDREIVTISSAVTIAKRPKPVREHHSTARHHGNPASLAESKAPVEPRVRPLPQPAALRAPSEIAKEKPNATPQPPRPERHPLAASGATSPRHHASSQQRSEQRVAYVQTPTRNAPPHLSQTQLAKIENDLAKTIAQARSAENPLNALPKETPAAPKRYNLDMKGKWGQLRAGEGYWSPISQWQAGGWDWYYVSYEFMWEDGTLEHGNVPWPIRFPTRNDPLAHGLQGIELPPPLPGFQLTPDQFAHLGKALRQFFPGVRFPNST